MMDRIVETKIGLAVKLELTTQAQDLVAEIVSAAGYTKEDIQKLSKNLHLTIGFIDNPQDPDSIGQMAVIFLNKLLAKDDYTFEVDHVDHTKFNKITALQPTQTTIERLKALNLALEEYLDKKGVKLNNRTTNGHIAPHITLKHGTTDQIKADAMNKVIETKKQTAPSGAVCFRFETASFSKVVMKR